MLYSPCLWWKSFLKNSPCVMTEQPHTSWSTHISWMYQKTCWVLDPVPFCLHKCTLWFVCIGLVLQFCLSAFKSCVALVVFILAVLGCISLWLWQVPYIVYHMQWCLHIQWCLYIQWCLLSGGTSCLMVSLCPMVSYLMVSPRLMVSLCPMVCLIWWFLCNQCCLHVRWCSTSQEHGKHPNISFH